MRTHTVLVMIASAAALVPSRAAAQHDAHQTATAPCAQLAQCAQVQPAVQNILAAVTARLESARQSNSPAEMRAAIEHFEGALRDIRTQLTPCEAAATDPHAGHQMRSTQTAPTAAPTAKPEPSKRTTPAPPDPHAGHAAEPQPSKQMDPVNGLMVDPATAPKTTYQGQTYYFSSEESRKQFLENPAKFAKKPKE